MLLVLGEVVEDLIPRRLRPTYMCAVGLSAGSSISVP